MRHSRSRNRTMQGFSLVEVMVGLTVGLIASMIIAQVISSGLSSRNTNRAASDSLENGLFALQTIGADLRSAGSGFAGSSAFSCYQAYSSYGSGNAAVSWLNGNVSLVPVAIKSVTSTSTWTNHANYQVGSDVIVVRDAGRILGAATASLRSETHPLDSNPSMQIDRLYGFAANDVLMISDGATCILATVDPNLDPTNTTSSNGSYYSTSANAGTGMGAAVLKYSQTTGPASGFTYATNSLVFNVGHAHESASNDSKNLGGINENEYFVPVAGAKLQYFNRRTGADAEGTAIDLADNIVAIKAQYGIVNPVASTRNNYDGTMRVAHWVGPDSGSAWTTTLDSTNAKLTSLNKVGDTTLWATGDGSKVAETAKLIKAIRIVIVARSANREASVVTQACDTGTRSNGPCPWGPTPTGTSNALDTDQGYPDPIIDLSQVPVPQGKSVTGDDAEWKHYRYRIYTTVIPVRSLVWNPS